MKMSIGVEQSLVILVLLSINDNQPIKSRALSQKLDVSDSYLKKTMRKLVVAEIVEAIASKDGGYTLARQPKDITLLDVYEAIEGTDSFIQSTKLAGRVFDSPEMIEAGSREVLSSIHTAENRFKDVLKQSSIQDLLPPKQAK
ncbi:Rrf2 family transcriptional regulator [Fructobacillus ficulneus]|uniref:BadM/Rrf2 family transcriptional regulator n=1 Tax=Fructobacillus ficulneus TaxID=157463 RepID=A0A0K8MHW8_9LACO|nr:Rrf2 family transcriptional regulator [Fructobacillus ficulneus]GAO99788.1 BadM/Rrf2 family transcriptional regulator [Fructobacillus ficulneus]